MSENTPHVNPGNCHCLQRLWYKRKLPMKGKKRQNASKHPQVAYILSSIQAISRCDGKVQTLARAGEKNISHPSLCDLDVQYGTKMMETRANIKVSLLFQLYIWGIHSPLKVYIKTPEDWLIERQMRLQQGWSYSKTWEWPFSKKGDIYRLDKTERQSNPDLRTEWKSGFSSQS